MWYLVDLDQDTSGCGCLCRFRSGVQLENLPCLKSLAGTEACVESDQASTSWRAPGRSRSDALLENLPCLKSLAGTEACVDSIRSHVDGGCLVDFGQASSDELAPHRGAGV
ncbi:hypothetical protein CBS147346_7664 [Aspergillus niger]|nr:hypothetical protein CBS147346_7664 [Aspergillus niger]